MSVSLRLSMLLSLIIIIIIFPREKQKINSQEYINILEKKHQKSMNKTNTNILLHDKATVHMS